MFYFNIGEDMKSQQVKHEEDLLSCGCGHCHNEEKPHHASEKGKSILAKYKFDLLKILFSVLFLVCGIIFNEKGVLSIIFYACAIIVCGYELIISCTKNVIKGNFFDENTLMLVASITAFILKEYFESAFILILFNLGEILESVATESSRKKIVGLAELNSEIVHLINEKGILDISPEMVKIGSLIEVKKGEKVPIDGVLIGGQTELDMKALTGESRYYFSKSGEVVYSGAINVGNPFVLKTTKEYKDCTVQRIISVVEGALSKKAKSQKFITKFAKVYTPLIVFLSLAIATLPPLFDGMNFVKWIYKALSFLVVSCPCALVISVPLAFFVGIGSLAKNGVLVKGSSYIEILANVKNAVFDKTGTLTKGDFEVVDVKTIQSFDSETVLNYVYSIEKYSTHPISKAIVNSISGNLCEVSDIDERAGCGIVGLIDNKTIAVGNVKLLRQFGIKIIEEKFPGTIIYVAIDGVLAQKIYIADKIRDGALDMVKNLKKLGVNHTCMLSGDSKDVAESVGKAVNIDTIYSELMPEEKLNVVKEIIKSKGKTLFVGDGINDSPALAVSNVGIAMGGLGSEIAIESADMVIMDDDIRKIPMTIKYSKRIKSVVLMNIIGSILVKLIIMLASVLFTLPIWVSMLGDVGVMLLAVLNALFVGKVKVNR